MQTVHWSPDKRKLVIIEDGRELPEPEGSYKTSYRDRGDKLLKLIQNRNAAKLKYRCLEEQ